MTEAVIIQKSVLDWILYDKGILFSRHSAEFNEKYATNAQLKIIFF